jgi:hypothetical protein
MKIQTLVVLLLFGLIGGNVIHSQIITFDKTLPGLGATQVLQMDDGGYLLNCEIKLIKTNQDGYVEWIKENPQNLRIGKSMIKTLDGGYAAVANVGGVLGDIYVIKFNEMLDAIWIKNYNLPDYDEEAHAIIQLPDSSFVVSSKDGTKYLLRKTDSNGSLIWVKEFSGLATLNPSFLISLNNDGFLYWKPPDLIRMNFEAEIIWRDSLVRAYTAMLTEENNILVSTQWILRKYNLEGYLLWENDNYSITSMTRMKNGNYGFIRSGFFQGSPTTCGVMDTSGNIMNSFLLENRWGKYLSVTNEGGFIICGSDPYAWLIKTDSNLEYNAINLKKPLDGASLLVFNIYPIIWESNNVEYVNLEYSIDNKNTWGTIINYYPAESDTFYWTLPKLPSGDLFIRISDSFNSEVNDQSDPPQKALIYQASDYIAANEIFMWIHNDGLGSVNPELESGFYWSSGKDTSSPVIWSDGLIWGGKVNNEVRVNGIHYSFILHSGLKPGYILTNGQASDPLDIKAKIFKLKKNWQLLPPNAERERYEFDYLNWPVELGAPWNDKNGDNIFTLGTDEPAILGEETLFFVANDLDTAASKYNFGSDPLGLEFQVTTFGYNSELLKDVVFKKYRVINKGPNTISDMYLTYWTDDNIGWIYDDFGGCDTALNLGYTYNGDNFDEVYYGTAPPSVGHLIIQPPIIQAGLEDSARYGSGWKKGFRNIPINSFIVFKKPINTTWPIDTVSSQEYYELMKGLDNEGNPVFMYSGDPVAGSGWNDSGLDADRSYIITSGPFDMAPSDTQEVVIAILIKRGTNNLNSVTQLKNYAALIQNWYDNDFVTSINLEDLTFPLEYFLSQNYPNPFNPTTKIKYSIPAVGTQRAVSVQLKVYDILGTEIATLVNEYKHAGSYEVEFDGKNFAAGIYFFRITAGNWSDVKKMILLK